MWSHAWVLLFTISFKSRSKNKNGLLSLKVETLILIHIKPETLGYRGNRDLLGGGGVVQWCWVNFQCRVSY